jgi:hypothetical protein
LKIKGLFPRLVYFLFPGKLANPEQAEQSHRHNDFTTYQGFIPSSQV